MAGWERRAGRDRPLPRAGDGVRALVGAARAQDWTGRPYAPGTSQRGERPAPDRPGFGTLPGDEDWSFLRERARRTDPLDGLKFIPLGDEAFLTLGLDARGGYERYRNFEFGRLPGYDGYWQERLLPSVALTAGRWRLYGALRQAAVDNRRPPVPASEFDRLDLHQGFAELAFGDLLGLRRDDAFLRVGRQELHYGDGRIISVRGGPNLRDDFDGGVARLRAGPWIADVFGAADTRDGADAFDNTAASGRTLWGAYGTRAVAAPVQADAYYVGYRRTVSAFVAGTGGETRHSVGTRLWVARSAAGGWSGDVEATVSLGEFRPLGGTAQAIRAYGVSGQLTHGWPDRPLAPVLGTRWGYTSGDDDPRDGTLGTARSPHPPGRLFGEASNLGPGNLVGVRPSLQLSPVRWLLLDTEVSFFWRASTADGVYSPPGLLLRGALGGRRYVGRELSLRVTAQLDRHLALQVAVAGFAVGGYLRDNPPARDIAYAEARVLYRF